MDSWKANQCRGIWRVHSFFVRRCGDIGYVTYIDSEEEELTATFDDNIVTYPFKKLDELVLCYAATIHKLQGRHTRQS